MHASISMVVGRNAAYATCRAMLWGALHTLHYTRRCADIGLYVIVAGGEYARVECFRHAWVNELKRATSFC